ncbi:MAG: helix-turn-helix domain-containing protein, partial [Anaerolineae bacterium]
MASPALSLASFPTFGDLLKFLRRRERLTQLDLSIAVGYSEAQISRLEQNQRLPDLAALKALFIPALGLEDEPELAGRLLELAQSARQEDAPVPGIPPYKGLLYFDQDDSDIFFGREALTSHLLERVAALPSSSTARLLAIVGASGSGKSSLARSGLGVGLKRAGWELHLFTPGADPLRALRQELEKGDSGTRTRLVLIDQFEETFTLCREEISRAGFIHRLLDLARAPGGEISVVIALRADFYSHLAQYPELREAVAARQEYIGQMTASDLRRAIEEPARNGGWQFEPGLVDVMLQDIGVDGVGQPEPGALPLLSHALLETWQRRRGRLLTLEGYRAAGGVQSAIAETAESVFTDQLNREQQDLARSIFLRLTELGEGTEDTRRRASLNELVRRSEEAPKLRSVLDALATARLVTLNEDSAEVAHEALIREWQRLRQWLTDDRDGLRLHRHLSESAHEWQQRNSDPNELYRGARLAQAGEWAASNESMLNPLERAFLAASLDHEHHAELEREAQRKREVEAAQKLAESEARSARRLRLRNRIISMAGAITLLLAVVAFAFALQSRRNTIRAQAAEAQAVHQKDIAQSAQATAQAEQIRTDEERRVATSRELAAAALSNLNIDADRSVLLSLYAVSQAQTKEAQEALHAALLNLRTRASLTGLTGPVASAFFSPDGKRVATVSYDNTAAMWDAASGKQLFPIRAGSNGIASIAFSPDWKRIATVDTDGKLAIWELDSASKLADPSGYSGSISALAFSSDGSRLAAGSGDGTARVWDARTGRQLLLVSGHSDQVRAILFSPDDSRLITTSNDNTTRVWDVATGRQLLLIPGPDLALSAAISPDGTRLAIGYFNGSIKVCDARTGDPLLNWSAQTGVVGSVAFSPDGTRIASAGEDEAAHIWDSSTGLPVLTLAGGMDSVAFSPDGRFLATEMPGNSARVWDISLAGPHELLTVDSGHADPIRSLSFSSDGTRWLTTSNDGIVQTWDAMTGREVLHISAHLGTAYDAAYSPDGSRFVTAGADNVARIWDAATGRLLLALAGQGDGTVGQFFHGIMDAAFSPDGNRVATVG